MCVRVGAYNAALVSLQLGAGSPTPARGRTCCRGRQIAREHTTASRPAGEPPPFAPPPLTEASKPPPLKMGASVSSPPPLSRTLIPDDVTPPTPRGGGRVKAPSFGSVVPLHRVRGEKVGRAGAFVGGLGHGSPPPSAAATLRFGDGSSDRMATLDPDANGRVDHSDVQQAGHDSSGTWWAKTPASPRRRLPPAVFGLRNRDTSCLPCVLVVLVG